MKILDSSLIIAIFDEICKPELIDKIIQLGHSITIPASVHYEIRKDSAFSDIIRLVEQDKIQILTQNTKEEITTFQKKFPGLGLGESDVLLSYQKLQNGNERMYCVLDDKTARRKAAQLNIQFTGLLGLLKLMKERNIIDPDEVNDIGDRLQASKFRIPPNFFI